MIYNGCMIKGEKDILRLPRSEQKKARKALAEYRTAKGEYHREKAEIRALEVDLAAITFYQSLCTGRSPLGVYAHLVWLGNKQIRKGRDASRDRKRHPPAYAHKDRLIGLMLEQSQGYSVAGTELYLHEFVIDGQCYSFHSYIVPANLCGVSKLPPGGGRFGKCHPLPPGVPGERVILAALDYAAIHLPA